MPRVIECPSAEVLQSFLLGQRADPEADALAQHLEQCEHCLQVAAVVPAEDRLVATARQVEAAPIEPPFGELVEGLIERCTQLCQATPTASALTTASFSAAGDPETDWTHLLGPAQGPGELGRLGTYRVLRVLGSGGMGVVFSAEDVQLGRPVALKIVRPGLAAEAAARERFLREARAAASVKHDHVVTIYQVGEERGTPFLAMEYLEGETLDARLRRQSPLPVPEVLRIGREIAEGLAAAHERGVTHRDIKPSNVWLEERVQGSAFRVQGQETESFGLNPESRPLNPPSRVKILDFGLARSLHDPRSTQSGQTLGTPAYMAPEQARDARVDYRADLFSLGCVLYQMAAGDSPFLRSDAMATLMAVATFHPAPLTQRQPEVPAALSALVMQLLSKEPAGRPASAQKVADSLWKIERSLAAEGPTSVAEPADSMSERSRRGRPRVRVALAVAVVLLSGAGAVALWHRANERHLETPSIEPLSTRHSPLTNSPNAPPASWPVDALRREQIPDQQLRIAGHGDPQQAPAELVAILGDGRLCHWCGPDDLAFSSDGNLLVSACGGHTVRLWDVSDGGLIRTLAERPSVVYRVAFSPDSQVVVVGDADGTLLMVEVPTGKVRWSFDAHQGRIWCLAFSHDGLRLASGAEDGHLRLWDATTGEELHTLTEHTRAVEAVAFLPNSYTLVSGGADGSLRLWDLDTRKESTTLRNVQGRVLSVKISLDGRRLAYGIWADRTPAVVKVLEATDNSTMWNDLYILSAYPEEVAQLSFRPDGQVLACANHNHWLVRQWDMETGRELPALTGHKWGTSAAAFHPDGKRLASAGWDGAIRVWDSITGEEQLPRSGHQSWVNGIAFSHDGQLLATGSMDSTIKLWDVATGEELRTLISHRGEVTSLEFRRDGQLLASGSTDGTVKLWDTRSWKVRTLTGHGGEVRCVAFNSDGSTVASASADQTIKLWETNTGLEVRTLSGHLSHVNSVAWAPDDQVLVSGSPDGSVKLWESTSGLEIKHLTGHQSWVESVVYSSNGKLVASASNDNTIRLWNAHTGQPISTLLGHEAQVYSVTFSPDAETMASSSLDGTIRLWNPSTSICRQVIRLGSPRAKILKVAFSPDGRHIATANGNGTVYILRLPPPP